VSLTHVGCPSCGGTLSLAEGQRLVTCRYCGGRHLALIPDAVPRYAVHVAVAAEEARRIAQDFLRRPGRPRAVRERGRIQDVRLSYVPFYEVGGTRIGTFLLRESGKPRPPTLDDPDDERDFEQWLLQPSMETQGTRVIEQDYLRVGPACDLPELGVDRIPLEQLRRAATPVALEGYDLVELQKRAVVFAPTKPPNRLVDERERRIAVRGDRTGMVERRVRLVYYPVWQARYEYRGRPFEVAVDGVQGTILRANAPREFRRAALLAVILLAVGAFCFGRPAGALFSSARAATPGEGWLAAVLGAVAGLVLGGGLALFLAWLAWTAFRHTDDVVLMDGDEVQSGAEPALRDIGEGFADRILERLLRRRGRAGKEP